MTHAILNVAAWKERSVANGPGERFVIWLQGCRLHCPGCFNGDFQAEVPRHLIDINELAEKIRRSGGIEGVTYTGGEPTLQAQALALLSEEIRPFGSTVVCYTGYTLEWLQRHEDPWLKRLLACVDILIDGPYIQEQATNLAWRGSRNQRLHFLSDAYTALAGQFNRDTAQIEFGVDTAKFSTTGTWPEGFMEKLYEVLRR